MGVWERIGEHGKVYIETEEEFITRTTLSQDENKKIQNDEILKSIKDTDTKLVRFIEDLAIAIDTNKEKFEILGVVLPNEILKIVTDRKKNRAKLK